MATVQIYDLASRVYEPEGQRLEIGPTADDVVLLVLRHVKNLTAEAMALRVHLFADRVLPSRAQRRAEAGELRARDVERHVPMKLKVARCPDVVLRDLVVAVR